MIDPYFDISIGTLRNRIGAKSAEELKREEAQIAYANEFSIQDANIQRTNDYDELCAIHRFIFSDIYDWAGDIRTVDIRKDVSGAIFFLPTSKIIMGLGYVFDELKTENFLRLLDKEQFNNKLAYFYDQLNFVHPFRDGNGRVQRIFWTRVAHDAGFEIDWTKVLDGENDEASRVAAETQDVTLLCSMFTRIVNIRREDE